MSLDRLPGFGAGADDDDDDDVPGFSDSEEMEEDMTTCGPHEGLAIHDGDGAASSDGAAKKTSSSSSGGGGVGGLTIDVGDDDDDRQTVDVVSMSMNTVSTLASTPGRGDFVFYEDLDDVDMAVPRVLGRGVSAAVTLVELPNGRHAAEKRVKAKDPSAGIGEAFVERELLFASRYQRFRMRRRGHSSSEATSSSNRAGPASAHSAHLHVGGSAPSGGVMPLPPAFGQGSEWTSPAVTPHTSLPTPPTTNPGGQSAAAAAALMSSGTSHTATNFALSPGNHPLSGASTTSLVSHHRTTPPRPRNVVPLLKASLHTDGSLTLWMKVMYGGDATKPFPLPYKPGDVVRVTRDVLRGLQSLHDELQLVHRDLQARNILFDTVGNAYVSDFGCCASAETQPTDQSGAVLTMSPERLRGEKHGPPSDIWSLGLTIAELLLGKHPLARCIPEDQKAASFWCLVTAFELHDPDSDVPAAVKKVMDDVLEDVMETHKNVPLTPAYMDRVSAAFGIPAEAMSRGTTPGVGWSPGVATDCLTPTHSTRGGELHSSVTPAVAPPLRLGGRSQLEEERSLDWLKTVIVRCTASDPAERPTVRDLLDEAERQLIVNPVSPALSALFAPLGADVTPGDPGATTVGPESMQGVPVAAPAAAAPDEAS